MYAFNDNWLDRGTCNLCSKSLTATGFTSHLMFCIPKTLGLKREKLDPGAMAGARKTRYLQLRVGGTRDYWLHLGIRSDATLSELDRFLRELWLECCGHLSAFRIQEASYESSTWNLDSPGGDSHSMDVAIGQILPHKTPAWYTYDFGTSTDLYLEITNRYTVPDSRKDPDRIQVLARNIAPEFACDTCGKPAQYLEVDEDDMWEYRHYCNDHQPENEGYGYNIVNSPRCGVCAYGQDFD
ncbi:MAG: hypothetical protein OXC13_00675 [Caldilineaceae bacterium]|nr:hypothetical protein [Caldilineaceae bacterium]